MIHGGGCLVLCPQGPVEMPVGGGERGYCWFPLVPGSPPDEEAFRHAASLLRDFVAYARERYPVDPAATVAGGFSQGGLMAYDLVLRDPARFSGLLALSTYLPGILADDLPHLPEQEGLPTLVIHGTADPAVDVERAREARETLRTFGVSLTYREFDMRHEIRPEALRVAVRWLDERAFAKTGRTPPTASDMPPAASDTPPGR